MPFRWKQEGKGHGPSQIHNFVGGIRCELRDRRSFRARNRKPSVFARRRFWAAVARWVRALDEARARAASPRRPRWQPTAVRWEVATDDRMRNVVRMGMAEVDSRWAHSAHVEVAGLEPGRPYWYRFTALGEQSPIGIARTAPAPDAKLASMRFAFASCSNWQAGYFSAYRHMPAENPDLVVFLGDYIYESTATGARADKVVRKHDGPTAVDLAGYRNRYALYRTDPDLQALHAAAPCLMTWDDHEVENDYADEWSELVETKPEDFLRWPLSGSRPRKEEFRQPNLDADILPEPAHAIKIMKNVTGNRKFLSDWNLKLEVAAEEVVSAERQVRLR